MRAYAYASNNPVVFSDSTGQDIRGDKKTCSPESLKLIDNLRKKLRNGNIKSQHCADVFKKVGLVQLATSDTIYEIVCSTGRAKVPDCAGEEDSTDTEATCGAANTHKRCATIDQDKNRKGCPSVPARIAHEATHLCGPWPTGTGHGEQDFKEVEKCADIVGNET